MPTDKVSPSKQKLPQFSLLRSEDIVPSVELAIYKLQYFVEEIVSSTDNHSWESLCLPLAEKEDYLARIWSPIQLMSAVKDSQEWRVPYEKALQMLTCHSSWICQHQGLYRAYASIKESEGFARLTMPQRKAVENALRDFRLSGVALQEKERNRYAEISVRLSEASNQFSNNVLDATKGWHLLVADLDQLAGLPESALASARAMAELNGELGWRLTLDTPTYLNVMTYCDSREVRQQIYYAYHTRASELGPNGGCWDNSQLMCEILALRLEGAKLLGFKCYAEQSLATKMAKEPKQVIEFLADLARLVRPQAERELANLRRFASEEFEVAQLELWDVAYYSEKYKQHLYSISDEQLRLYFPLPKVLYGLFKLVNILFNINIQEIHGVDTWHPDVSYFGLFNKDGKRLGGFYLDIYVRDHKHDGAWMSECINGRVDALGDRKNPEAYLICNFTPPASGEPSLLTLDEVETLFHEFGHGLHHLLTEVEVAAVSGMNGVPWDFVELPSQILENWCWRPESLGLISAHYMSGDPLPEAMLERLLAARNFQSALSVMRQLELSTFDFQLHRQTKHGSYDRILELFTEIKSQFSLFPRPTWLRTPHTFSHIFSGSYAAGYYSYFWAEVLAADAFSRFEEEGVMNANVGHEFAATILARGGVDTPEVMFRRFRAREPSIEAFLRHRGIMASQTQP